MASDRSTRWWLAPVIGLIVLFTAAAGLVARHVYQQPAPTMLPLGSAAATSSSATGMSQSQTVTLSEDAKSYPQGDSVRAALQNYFDGINHQSYQVWTKAVTRERLNAPGSSESIWRSALKSTTDTAIVIRRIESAPNDRLIVLLSFTSWQNVGDAPKYAPYSCILWNVAWPFAQQNGQWKLDVGPASNVPAYSQCH